MSGTLTGVKSLGSTHKLTSYAYGKMHSRAKAGIMQRISMVTLRATARQVIRGVALVGAANVQAHRDRWTEKTAEAAKYLSNLIIRRTTRSGQTTAAPSAPSTKMTHLLTAAPLNLGRLRPAQGRRRSPPLAHW